MYVICRYPLFALGRPVHQRAPKNLFQGLANLLTRGRWVLLDVQEAHTHADFEGFFRNWIAMMGGAVTHVRTATRDLKPNLQGAPEWQGRVLVGRIAFEGLLVAVRVTYRPLHSSRDPSALLVLGAIPDLRAQPLVTHRQAKHSMLRLATRIAQDLDMKFRQEHRLTTPPRSVYVNPTIARRQWDALAVLDGPLEGLEKGTDLAVLASHRQAQGNVAFYGGPPSGTPVDLGPWSGPELFDVQGSGDWGGDFGSSVGGGDSGGSDGGGGDGGGGDGGGGGGD